MEDKRIVNTSHWKEPAHPTAIKFHDDLVSIYTHIREKYQQEIDNAFDRISRQIGFVVTTSVPVMLKVEEEGTIKSFTLGMKNLKDTIFEKELSTALEPMLSNPMPGVSSGNYNIYLLWFEALKLKLRTDWMEPVHYRYCIEPVHPPQMEPVHRPHMEPVHFKKSESVADIQQSGGRIPRPWLEPAHWFDPRIELTSEEATVLSAIDLVYPELKLMDRAAASREAFWKAGH
ncbi:MAG: hypothetical protein J5U19_05545 [Candidatus Methanoperedens sp.]|nr:hypothetical protein [Candidatus Methanoperedens sp.]